METLIKQLAEVRNYKFDGGKFYTEDNIQVLFFYTPVFDQEFLNSIDFKVYSIVLCDKQKKIKIPKEFLVNIEIHIVKVLKLQITAHKFKPRHVKLSAEEYELMNKHYNLLPILLSSDPASIVHGFKPKDIVKIYRLNGSIFFRRVEE